MSSSIILLLLAGSLLLAGCITAPTPPSNQTTTTMNAPGHPLDVKAIINYNPLGGLTERKGEGFYVIAGAGKELSEAFESLVMDETKQKETFSAEEQINLVVFRGIFPTGGHGIAIDRAERSDGTFIVYATYTDPGPGMMVTQAFTQPTAIVPLGQLEAGRYEAVLIVTRIQRGETGSNTLEDRVEQGRITFEVE